MYAFYYYMCIYVCINIRLYVCMITFTPIYTYKHLYANIYVCTCISVWIVCRCIFYLVSFSLLRYYYIAETL